MSKVRTNWTGYYMYNDEVLDYLNRYNQATGIQKEKIQDELVNKLTYLVQARIKGYRGKPYYMDLLQEGRVGLLKAIENFDPLRGINFFKYAVWVISSQVRIYLRWQKRCSRKVKKEEASCTTSNVQPEEIDPQIQYELCEQKSILMEAINCLPEIDKKVVTMRFGIGTHKHTLEQLGNIFSLSRQRIQQIEVRAISKLKKNNKFKQMLKDGVIL